MGSLATPLATLGILSIGDMGVGIARLLIANNFRVLTNASDRSQATQKRVKENAIGLVSNDIELCNNSDYILSIVPPRDAIPTAQRVVDAATHSTFKQRTNPLYFLDLNAISPKSTRTINDIVTRSNANLRFIDGGIVGGPPKKQDDGTWTRPSVPTSGPHRLDEAKPAGDCIAGVINAKYLNSTIGAATGLKMCFASLSKGFTGLAIQSFTTAQNLGVLPELKSHMEEFNPNGLKHAERSLPAMCPKAYRWVHEMREIAATFEADGGFEENESPFRGIAGIYDLVANGTELGKEVTEDRKQGRTADEVARLMGEGTERRKLKTD